MRKWKSTIDRGLGIWSSEIRLKDVSLIRLGKVKKLLKLLKKESLIENLP